MTYKSIKLFLTLSIVISSSVYFIEAYGQENTGSVEVEVLYSNGDRIDFHEATANVYEIAGKEPLVTQQLSSNPFVIDSLSLGQDYKIEILVNNMIGGYDIVSLKNDDYQKSKVTIPLSGGLQVEVFYKDGSTPVEGATVVIKSHDGKEWRRAVTGERGETLRYWLQSTGGLGNPDADDHYIIEVFYGNVHFTTISPVKLTAGLTKDQKIVLPVPNVVQDLITLNLQNVPKQLNYENLVVSLYDWNGIKVNQSPLTIRDKAHFSNLKPGEYSIELDHKNTDKLYDLDPSKIIIDGKQNNYLISVSIPEPIEEQENKTRDMLSCNCVAFRFDDVQDYWLNEVQMNVIEIFTKTDTPLTIGIIADSFGDDQKITSYVKEKVQNKKIEIANHGLTNTPLTEFDREQQKKQISDADSKILAMLGVKAKVLIPPQNRFNADTLSVLNELGFTHMSSSIVQGDTPPFPLENSTLYRFPEIATTGIFDAKLGRFVILPANQTYNDMLDGIDQYGFAVVTLHPQEFTVIENDVYVNKINQTSFSHLEVLLEMIRSSDLQVVPISKINLDSDKIQIPDWIKNNAGWWADGQISDTDFVQGIQYLISHNIMHVPKTQSNESFEAKIPDWIKNNAGWWADGQISDTDFVQGIQYLIQNGIIKY